MGHVPMDTEYVASVRHFWLIFLNFFQNIGDLSIPHFYIGQIVNAKCSKNQPILLTIHKKLY